LKITSSGSGIQTHLRKTDGQTAAYYRMALSKRTIWRWFHVSMLIRSEVMAVKVFLTFLVTLTLTFDLWS